MKIITNKFFLKTLSIAILTVCSLFDASAAPRAAVRGSAASRQPVTAKATTTTVVAEPKVVETDIEPVETSEPILNKSAQFDSVLSSSTTTSSNDSAMADRIREQRAAIAAKEATETVAAALQNALGGKNVCDSGLRKCMSDDKVCGKDFTKCALDNDTIFGDKLNKCRRDTTCTGEEFKLFTAEIKADRDMNVELQSYNAVIDCGNEYNKCIANECGMTYGKCLGKSASDKAIDKCKSIATKCKEQDSGLASRFGTVIGKLRENAEVDIKKDEERMYALRDLMKNACTKMGAMFDERSFDCVYTVNFFAGKNQENPMASRKAYAGDMFTCNQEWFGIDVTTFKENAYRETRAQKGASAAFLGAGIGTATGLITSGAMGRALDRQKAEKEAKAAKKEQEAASKGANGSSEGGKGACADGTNDCEAGKEKLAREAAEERRKNAKVGETYEDEYGRKQKKTSEHTSQDVTDSSSSDGSGGGGEEAPAVSADTTSE
jgi:hypothetical protein